uniref:Uncharacterized protein n=1 Tax=Triticum urartu TaxID=4572 RepID=A0A8R7QX36_TRIUA
MFQLQILFHNIIRTKINKFMIHFFTMSILKTHLA